MVYKRNNEIKNFEFKIYYEMVVKDKENENVVFKSEYKFDFIDEFE